MDVVEAIKKRKSIRAFKHDSVSKKIIGDILEIAGCSPSATNSQPWEFAVLSGEVLEKAKQANIDSFFAGTLPEPEYQTAEWSRESIYWKRQVDLAKEIFRLMDIAREDKEKRVQWMQRGFRYFDAPAAIIILTDRMLGEVGPLIDLGIVMQTICLAALNYDLGTCIADQGVSYPKALRSAVDIPDSKRIVMSIAIGYPDLDFPANRLVTTREPTENITTWYGF